jgi:hypothetical protein
LVSPAPVRRSFDLLGYTLNVAFMMLFAYGITYKVFDTLNAGDVSADLHVPLWTGYAVASLGVIAATILACLRWWEVVVRRL